MPESQEQRDSAVVTSAGEPGPLSRLLHELFEAPSGDLLEAWKRELQPGDRLGRFEIRREVGRGGFGAVYEAFDTELSRVVAVKTLRLSRPRRDLSSDWIKKEAEAVARLDHPCIVTLFDVGTCDSGAYLVMELLRGETLAKRIEKGPVPVVEALRIAEQMAEGLAHAHQRGVLHRDLKPANVFLCEDGRVKLLDFGLAHLLGTEGSSGAGTPAYMAPEQAAGAAVDERADVYAAGMVLGEMLTGKRPVERTPTSGSGVEASEPKTELMWEAPKVTPQAAAIPGLRLTGVPRPVAKVMAAALSEDPGARPRDGSSWLSELRSARMLVERPRRIRRTAAFATAFVLLGLSVAGLATWRVWRRQVPLGRITVAVADVTNGTGESELDALSGLLVTSLEQSRRIAVLTRARMLDLARQAGNPTATRIDEHLGRDLARKGDVAILLVPAVYRVGATYAVELRALDPEHDRYVFSLREEASTKNGLLGVVDRLSDRARRELQEPAAEVDAGSIRVGDAVSRSLEAYQHYTAGMDRYYREGDAASAVAEFRKAVKLDPDFSAAHLELSALDLPPEGPARGQSGSPASRVEPFWSLAMAGVERMPEKERLWVKLAGAVLGFHAIPAPGEAARLTTELEERFPDDKVSLLKVSGALRSLARIQVNEEDRATLVSRATRAMRRVVELDPGHYTAARDLISIEQGAGNGSSAIGIARNLIAMRPSAETHAALAQALAFDGLCEDALRHVDEAITRSPNGSWLATFDSSTALVACGRFPEAEREVVRFLAAVGDRDPRSRLRANVRAFGLMALQGHCAEAVRHAEASVSHAWWYPGTRALLLSCGHDRLQAPRAREYVRSGWTAGQRENGATGAARLGEFETARSLAHALPPGSPSEIEYLAYVAHHEKRWEDAVGSFRRLLELVPSSSRLRAAGLLAETLLAAGRPADAITALADLDAALSVSTLDQQGHTWPPSMMVRARAREQVGDLAGAHADVSRLLVVWSTADPDLPLLLEAKAMQARLAVK